MKGFVNVFKPQNMSSAAVVSIVKKIFDTPCGHMGTLDPMAEGVLPVGIYKTTRLFPYLLDKEKRYIARFKFGVATDTLDTTGKVLITGGKVPTREEIERVLGSFIGEIDQIPPKFSAKCIDGKRGYQLARRGVEFELKPKKVCIKNIELIGQTKENEYEFVIDCKGGTYIRSLARDIGIACGSVATMSALIRERVGVFDRGNSVTIEELKKNNLPQKYILPPDLPLNFDKIILTNVQATRILNGIFNKGDYKDGLYSVYNESDFWGVGEVSKGVLKIKAYVR